MGSSHSKVEPLHYWYQNPYPRALYKGHHNYSINKKKWKKQKKTATDDMDTNAYVHKSSRGQNSLGRNN